MTSLHLKLFIIFTSLLAFACHNAQAATETVIEKQVVITNVPAAKEVVVTPSGAVRCFTVKEGWSGNEWIPEHQICQYKDSPEGLAWVASYWKCSAATADGACTKWDWIPGHWVKTFEVY